MEQLAYGYVSEITEAKKGNVEPAVATMNEIKNSMVVEITEALRSLCRSGVLAVSIDVNKQPMFKIINTE